MNRCGPSYRRVRNASAALKNFGRHSKKTFSTQSVESRCGAVALGRTYPLPPLSSGGALVVPPSLRFHIPLIEPDRRISRIRLSDKTSRFRVQRHLQLLNRFLELIGFPISRSFATYCVYLELRSLPGLHTRAVTNS